MLAHVLAIAVALSSIVLFLTAFSMSDIHKRDDFLWSGVGLFYALVLWFCASRITGSLLLGQVAAVALVISFNWQNLKLRKAVQRGHGGDHHEKMHQDEIANPEEAAETGGFSVTEMISGFFNRSGESNPQPNIAQVLEEETNTEELDTEIQNPIDTSTETETTAETSFSTLGETNTEEIATEIQNPINTATESETATDFEEIATEIQNPFSTATEPEIIVPTFADEEELEEIKEEQIQTDVPDLEEFISSPDKTAVNDETYSDFNLGYQAEKSNEENPSDVKFTTSETKENPSPSIDDFLAELDNSMDKTDEEK